MQHFPPSIASSASCSDRHFAIELCLRKVKPSINSINTVHPWKHSRPGRTGLWATWSS